MKQLIVGIDGGDESIVTRMPMPFLNGLIENGTTRQFTEDLLSRGWVEILCGKYARETKAFYMVPQCDGTPAIRFKYSLSELLANEEVTPIWRIPPAGSSVGMMNVPTTFPAQEVDGFFVSGAGGGVNKVDGIPAELCHPKSIVDFLSELGYKIDIRFGTAGIKDIDELFSRLCDMMERRAEAYVQLTEKHQQDFAFVTFRAPTVTQYLAMVELRRYFDQLDGKSVESHAAAKKWDSGFEKLYGVLDSCIEKVVEASGADHWIVTSDHGAVPYRYRVSTNQFLEDYGYLNRATRVVDTIKSAAKTVLRGPPFGVWKDIDFETATAFGHWYLSGIFVNEERRFGGPVKENQVDEVVSKLCDDFNSTAESKQHEMKAKPYRCLYPDAKFYDRLPDIKIHCSDEYFVSSDPGKFVRPNPDYAPLTKIDHVKGGMHSGQKGRHPLFCCDNETAKLIKEDDALDLTLVYKLTERIFANG